MIKKSVKISFLFAAIACFGIVSTMFTSSALADQITLDIPDVEVSVTKDADGYARFSFSDGRIQFITKTGEPAIPYLIIKALLPPGADLSTVDVQIERAAVTSDAVQSGESWEVKATPPPSTWDGEKVITLEEEPDDNPYATSIRFPYDIVGTVSSGTIWDKGIGEWQIIDIPVALFHYNPITKGLFTLKSDQAIITFEHKPAGRSKARPVIASPGRVEQRLRQLVVNFDRMAPEYRTLSKARSGDREKTGYVIITTRSIVSGSGQLNTFVSHKQARGFNVHVMTEDMWGGGTGDTAAENIREWLKDNYVRLNIEYVLLIGDPNPSTGDVPMKMLWPRNNATYYTQYKDSPSDYYYADLTGNWDLDGDGKYGEGDDDFGAGGIDRNYEVVVGRIPYYGNMNDLDSILAKIISYQNEMNQDWRKNVLLPMEPSDEVTPGYHLGEAIKDSLIVPKGWNYHRIYDDINKYDNSTIPIPYDTETVPCDVNNVTNAWTDSQFGAIFWWTHGSATSASDIMNLSSAAKLDNTHPGFTFQCSCTNSRPETSNNLSYSLLKNGAIATVGATRVSWYHIGETSYAGTSTNSGMTYEYARRLITDDMKSCGYALHDMKQTLIPGLWMNFTGFCIYGDPEVALIFSVSKDAPIISDIPDQSTKRDIAITVPFTISDDKTPASDLLISGSSSNTTLVPNGNIAFGGSGADRNITIIPAENKTGLSTITISANDGEHTGIKTFSLGIEQFADWEWQYPITPGRGNDFKAVWGSSENNVFVVGASGVILHYDGNGWTEMTRATYKILNGIWGSSEKDIFAVGTDGAIIHYDGNKWSEMSSGVFTSLNAVWGSSENDVFAVGEGIILHYDGAEWTEMASGTSTYLAGIWGSSANNVFAVGSSGAILHYDGTKWTEMMSGTSENLGDIWGSSANNVFAVGNGTILHYNGNKWTESSIDTSNWLSGVWGSSASNVFAVGEYGTIFHYDGNEWTEMISGTSENLYAIWGNAASNVFAVGEHGTIIHYDGNKWIKWGEMISGTSNRLRDIWGSSENDVFAVGKYGTILHYDGNNWTEMTSGTSEQFYGIWGSSASNVFAVGEGKTILHYDGTKWTEMISGFGCILKGIWGSSASNVFAVGEGSITILHYDGTEWTEMTSGPSEALLDIWGSSANNVFAVSDHGTIYHYDGTKWTEMTSGTSKYISGVWGSSANNVFAVGYENIFHYDGTKWTEMTSDTSWLQDIWGSSATNVFAVNDEGIILHYDGNKWTEMTSGTSEALYGIWGTSGNNVFAVGEKGTILHYAGDKGIEMRSDTSDLSDIWGTSTTNVFAVGGYGTILHYDGSNWTEMTSGTSKYLSGVWGSSENDVFAVGGDGTIFHYDGSNWAEMTSVTSSLWDIWGTSATNVFAVGGAIHHYDGREWTEMTGNGALSIWGSSGSNVFAVGSEETIHHYDGNEWAEMTSGTSTSADIYGIWGSSENDVFAVGGFRTILHYDGSNWTKMTGGNADGIFEDIWGSSENNVFVVGWHDTTILHYNGNEWTEMTSGTSERLNGIWGSSENDVFAVGDRGVILHYSPPDDNPVLLVTPDFKNISATSGAATFTVSNSGTGDFTWTATENESWFSVSPASGTNSGTLTVSYEANPGDTRTGTITITAPGAANSPKTLRITQAAKQAHFTPVWTGNPYNRMNLWVVGASIDGIPLSPGDEIAIFDGIRCVGAAIVSNEISYENILTIPASQDDGSGNGFTKGYEITFRFWDASAGAERTDITPHFKDITHGDPIDPPTFESNGDYGVLLEHGGAQQSIALSSGWNIMSSYLAPESTDMLTLVQPLINSGCLEKIISQTGGTVIQVFGQWKNTIGNYNPDEGYKIKLSCDTDFSVQGFSMMSQGNMYAISQASQISLSQGWNIISYPFASPQNVMEAVQPLIEAGTLVKVIDETGNTILQVFGNWTNNIGDFNPGEGYEIKVTADSFLNISEPASSALRDETSKRISPRIDPSHFIPIWTENPYSRMNLWVVGAEELEAGDEIGVFDGENCVGVGIISGLISKQTPLTIIISQDDGSGNGFTEENEISFRFWDASEGTETEAQTPDFLNITTGDPIDPPTFKGNGDYGITWGPVRSYGDIDTSGTVDLKDAISALKILTGTSINDSINLDEDVSANRKAGLEEVIYVLQVVSDR